MFPAAWMKGGWKGFAYIRLTRLYPAVTVSAPPPAPPGPTAAGGPSRDRCGRAAEIVALVAAGNPVAGGKAAWHGLE